MNKKKLACGRRPLPFRAEVRNKHISISVSTEDIEALKELKRLNKFNGSFSKFAYEAIFQRLFLYNSKPINNSEKYYADLFQTLNSTNRLN